MRRAPLPLVGARLSRRFLRAFDRESAAGETVAGQLPSCALSTIEGRGISEFLAATSNTLRMVEIVANDTIVVAGLVSAAAFGNCICARNGGGGASAMSVAVDPHDNATEPAQRRAAAALFS